MTRKSLTSLTLSLLLAGPLLPLSSHASQPTSAPIAAPAAQSSKRISLNTANAETLADHLVGIGPTKAEAIIAWRSKHGRFNDIQQLLEIKGIGTATLNKNRHLITL